MLNRYRTRNEIEQDIHRYVRELSHKRMDYVLEQAKQCWAHEHAPEVRHVPAELPTPDKCWTATYTWRSDPGGHNTDWNGVSRTFYFASRAEREAFIEVWMRDCRHSFSRCKSRIDKFTAHRHCLTETVGGAR